MAVKDGLPSTDFSRMNRNWVKAVAEESGGSGIPEIEESDEGKVLTVDNGEAVWATVGGAITVINASLDDLFDYSITFNKTWKELCDGAPTVIILAVEGGGKITQILQFQYYEGVYSVFFDYDGETWTFTTDSETGYPVQQGGD